MNHKNTDSRIERLIALYKTCKNRTEFRQKHPKEAYVIRRLSLESRVYGPSRNTKGYWSNFDHCLKAALSTKTRKEFELAYPGALKQARINDWMDELFKNHKNQGYTHAINTPHKLNDAQILSITMRYQTKKAFCLDHPSLYSHIMKYRSNKYDFFKHMKPLGNKAKRYVYKIELDNTIYIGLSCEPHRRFRQHKLRGPVKDLIKAGARLEILSFLLSNFEAVEMESRLIKEYTEANYKVLNSHPAGSLGAPHTLISNDQLYEAAKMCETRGDMSRRFQSYYRLAYSRGILDTLFKDHPNEGYSDQIKWDYEKILEVTTQDMNRSQLQLIYPGAYGNIFIYKKVDLEKLKIDRPNLFINKKVPNNTYTFEYAQNIAKDMTKTEFVKKYHSLANCCYEKQWINKLIFMQRDA